MRLGEEEEAFSARSTASTSETSDDPLITKRSTIEVSVDYERLQKLIEAVDQLDKMRRRPLPSDRKAKIIALLYEYCEQKRAVSDESIAMMMDAAS
ncbi:hypothetical protein NM74_08045 [Aeromonas hydrophila]|nr:hypothetical protein NM74_08045 [Aeromonas hydrophila]